MFHVLLFGMICVSHCLCGRIKLEPRYAYTTQGNKFIFNCHVQTGVHGLVIFKGEKSHGTVCSVGSTEKQTMSSTDYECSHVDENTYLLIIRNVSATHFSSWTCQSGGQKSNTVTLNVTYPPTVAIANVDSRLAFVYLLGENYTSLNCSVTAANPFPFNFTWYHGGKVVGRDQIYTIPTVKKSSSGLYRCVADNGIFSPGEDSVTVDVHFPPSVKLTPVLPCSGYTVIFGKRIVSLNCSVTAANPFPSNFTWYHEGKVVGRDQIYTLPTVYKSSSGLYRCVADNGILPPGEDSDTVDEHYPPTVQIGHTQIMVNESEDLTINCTADAHPKVTSLVWSKEGVGPIISENGTLHLKDIRKGDNGVYVCTATNFVTTCSGTRQSKQSSRTVTVHVLSTIPLYLVATAGAAAGLVVVVVGVLGLLYARRRHHRVKDAAATAVQDDDDNALNDQLYTEPGQDYLDPIAQSTPEDKYTTLTDRPGRDLFYTELSPLQEPPSGSKAPSDALPAIGDCFPSVVDNGSHYETMLPPIVGATAV
ncbi:hemicentin-1-like [Haliotis rubra]|uniref:hemicentin-1-like n=1 Tax=Haliotis rubra TaxID=36100 RepID=UPI001EE5715A|nr:hemicentin-1-like [Haliotis rubra]XP_046585471.1 hemicentin-1-like [Haliotis rubra]XP_046585472.1 hemicentin-1-like [Haliotis rubra]